MAQWLRSLNLKAGKLKVWRSNTNFFFIEEVKFGPCELYQTKGYGTVESRESQQTKKHAQKVLGSR